MFHQHFLHMMICFFVRNNICATSFFTPLKTQMSPEMFNGCSRCIPYWNSPFLGDESLRCRWCNATCNSLMSCSKPKTLSAWRGRCHNPNNATVLIKGYRKSLKNTIHLKHLQCLILQNFYNFMTHLTYLGEVTWVKLHYVPDDAGWTWLNMADP